MSQQLYEQYKEALRRGHIAAMHGRLEASVAAYEAAAALAPERALPHSSLGAVLQRLGRVDAAETAFSAALARAPIDEAALRGRAALRDALGRRFDAAADYERLAEVLEQGGRLVDACDAARRALELAESRARRRAVEGLVARLRASEADPAAAEALRLAIRLLEPPATVVAGSVDAPAADVAGTRGSLATSESQDMPGDSPSDDGALPGQPPADPGRALVDAGRLLDEGRITEARELLLGLAAAHRAAGRHDAAIDACLLLVAVEPSNVAVQLEIAANQAARGWSEVAAEKIGLLGRLAELDGDASALGAITAFAGAKGLPPGIRGGSATRPTD